MFGLLDLYKKFNQKADLEYSSCVYPSFLQKHIIDPTTKKMLLDTWGKNNDKFSRNVVKGLDRDPHLGEMKKLQIYLKQMKERRNVSFEHLPKTFLDWLEL